MGCGETFGRVILSIFNAVFLLASALMLAFGITAKVDQAAIVKVFNYLLPPETRANLQNTGVDINGIVVSNAVFMIIIGVIGLVIAGFGFFGACCLIKWMLVVYAILIILLLLGEIALIVFAAVYTSTFKDVIQLGMKESLTKGFTQDVRVVNDSVIPPTEAISASWTSVQFKEKCCGAYNYSDYSTFKTWSNNVSIPGFSGIASVPISCCSYNGAGTVTPSASAFIDIPGCLQGNPLFINQQNCYNAVINVINNFIQQYKGIAIGIAAGIAGIELILIVISFYLCCTHAKDSKYV